MSWSLLRRLRKRVRRQASTRPNLEYLEPRLAPANVDVLTSHYDAFLSGVNTQETVLTPAHVNSTEFGLLYSQPTDGYVYAQPLYKANLAIAGGTHNVVFVATEHDSVYAYDADSPTAGPGGNGLYWKTSFLNAAAGVTTVPAPQDVISADIVPEIGITGTPVLDAGGTLYVVAKTKELVGGVPHYVQRLHALDITTGLDRLPAVTIGDTTLGGIDGGYTDTTNVVVAGAGHGSDGAGHVRFNALRELQRPGLTIVNGVVYVAFASHGDNGPYHGWVVGYRTTDLALVQLFNTTPNAGASGIWQSGGAPAFDAAGNIYFAIGNGFSGPASQFDPSVGDYSESVLKITPGPGGQMQVVDYFTPFDWATLDQFDADLGSGGTMLLPDSVGSAQHPHLMVETGKSGKIYLIDRDNMGKFTSGGPDNVVQIVQLGPAGVWGNPAYFQESPTSGLIYYQGSGDVMKAFRVSGASLSGPITLSNTSFNFPGSQPSISSSGGSNVIAWALQVDGYATKQPAVLHAYDALNLSSELYTSAQTGSRDKMTAATKFTFPIVTNGHVYAGARFSLSVFGLFPAATTLPSAPTNLSGTALAGSQIQLSWTNTATNATGIRILRSQDGVSFEQIDIVSRFVASFTDSGLTPATQYYYRVMAVNQLGDSPPSNTASVRTHIAAPVVQIVDVCAGEISLVWTSTANDHYTVARSTDGTNYTTIATVPASMTSYMDLGLANGTYFYKVTAYSVFGTTTDSAASSPARATVGPINIDHSTAAGGFAMHDELQANGSAIFSETEHLARLNNNFGQAGSFFTIQRTGVRGFNVSFSVRLHEGTQPNPADGFAFVVQTNAPSALGGTGGSLGYEFIPNSVAVKFDVYDNEGETANSTGLFFNGDFPSIPHRPGEVNIPLDYSVVNLRSQSTKTITLSYDGTTLAESIFDPDTGRTFQTSYSVDISGIIGADTAYVGFTGGTGGLFSLQDILTWTYTEQENNLPPRAPSDVRVASLVHRDNNRDDVNLTWKCNNAYTAQNFVIERSTDAVTFTPIATVPVTTTSFTDPRVSPGAYYYRVRSSNAQGLSHPSNTATAEIHVPKAPLNLRVLNVFAQHLEIAWDLNSTDQSGFQIERSFDGVHFAMIGQVDAYTTTFIDTRFSAPVYYRVESLSATGVPGLPSNTLKVDSVGQFISQDVGDVALAGSATFDQTGAYAVNASGSDIWDTSDSFHYLYQPLSGDGEIVARVVDVGQTDFWAKAGVMIRESLDASARNAFTLETPPGHNEPVFQWRPDPGGFTNDSDNHVTPEPGPPIWLRLVRSGNEFSGFWATDINNGAGHGAWNQLGDTVEVAMASRAYVGLALTAHNNGSLNMSHFDHVQATQVSPPSLGAPGSLTVAHVSAYKSLAQVILAWQPGSDNESGFRIERSTDGTGFSAIATVAAGSTTFTDTGAGDKGLTAGTYYYRVKAIGSGMPDSAYSNVDSVRFALPGQSLTISHGFESASDLTVNGSALIFPVAAPVGTFAGHQDIGGVAAPGGATFDSAGTYTIQASGADIWDTSDSFQYVYKPLVGDGEIVARVVGVGPTDYWAKAGVMIRGGLAADAKNAFMLETPNVFGHNEPVFQWRTNVADFTNDAESGFGTQAAPVWLRLVRSGNLFTGYWAKDIGNGNKHGKWNQVGGPVPIDMANQVYVGLAVTAHNNSGVLNTTTFDHVSITGATAPLPPAVAELTDGNFGEAGGVFLNNRVGVANFTSAFTFQMTPGTLPMADGLTFVMQGAGPTALGPAGGGLGYGSDHVGGGGGLPRSVAIKFDIYNNSGEGINSTGLFTGGRSPTVRLPGLSQDFPDTSINLDGSGIDLSSTHPFTVTLAYDGITLTETITDTVTSVAKTVTYAVNIPALVGSDVAYVGFTGGTGGLTTVADILSWTLQSTLPSRPQPQLAAGGPVAAGGVPVLTAAELAPIAHDAVVLWTGSGLSASQTAKLNGVQYQIVTLAGGALGLTSLGASVVTLDATAAGYGWFVDPTAADDGEFGSVVTLQELTAGSDSPAFGRMDLLTVVQHELGHVLGLDDLDPQVAPHELMTETLSAGVRRLPLLADGGLARTMVANPEASSTLLSLQAPANPLVAPARVDTLDGSLLAEFAQRLPASSALALPLTDKPPAAHDPVATLTVVAVAADKGLLPTGAAVGIGGDDPGNGRDAFFARLGNHEEFVDLLGGDASEGQK